MALDEDEGADGVDVPADDTDETSEDATDVEGKQNGMVAHSFHCMTALSTGYNPVA